MAPIDGMSSFIIVAGVVVVGIFLYMIKNELDMMKD